MRPNRYHRPGLPVSQLWRNSPAIDMAKDIETDAGTPFATGFNCRTAPISIIVNDSGRAFTAQYCGENRAMMSKATKEILEYSGGLYEEGYVKLGHQGVSAIFKSMIKAAPALMKI